MIGVDPDQGELRISPEAEKGNKYEGIGRVLKTLSLENIEHSISKGTCQDPDPEPPNRDPLVRGMDRRFRMQYCSRRSNSNQYLFCLPVTFRMATKNYFLQSFFVYYSLKLHYQKIKVIKKSQNRRNEGFCYFFCLMIEGSGAGSVPYLVLKDPDPEGPKTYGSYETGSGSPIWY